MDEGGHDALSTSFRDATLSLLASFRSSDYVDDLCDSLASRQRLCAVCQTVSDHISAFLLASNTNDSKPGIDSFWPPRSFEDGGRSYSDGYRFLPPEEVQYMEGEKLPPNVVKHHAAAKDIIESAKICAFCEIIRVALIMDTFRKVGYPYDSATEPFQHVMSYIKFGKGSESFERAVEDLKASEDPIFLMLWDARSFKRGGCVKERFKLDHLRLVWQRPRASLREKDRKVVFTKLNAFRLASERNTKLVSKRQPLRSSCSTDAFDLMRSWLRRCHVHHKWCLETIAKEAVDVSERHRLPTRLLDVGNLGNEAPPRLVQTQSLPHGQWVALSHCWGEAEHHPLKTTKATLPDHMQCIPFSALPKTFIDAIVVTRVLGLRYLWIDSLCIVQDDEDDWFRESNAMGSIYENAILTLAASSARNCHDGLFIKRDYCGLQTPSVRFPGPPRDDSTNSLKEQDDHFSIGIEWRQEPFISPIDPYFISPLSTRGWATQEWILSRRVIHFLQDGLVWICKSHAEDEAGQQLIGRGLPQSEWCTEWGKIIQDHSARAFTFQKDKLIALEGLAREVAKTRKWRTIPGPDEWVPCPAYAFGIFEIDMPEHLLWSPIALGPKLNIFPSWSWAAHSLPIWFQFRDYDNHRQDEGLTSVCKVVSMNGTTGVLELEAKRSKVNHLLNRKLHEQEHSPLWHIAYRGAPHPGYAIGPPDQERLGWAVFDDGRDFEGNDAVYFLHLATADYYKAPTTEHYGLLLMKSNHSEGGFVRVGMGAVLETSWMGNNTKKITRLI